MSIDRLLTGLLSLALLCAAPRAGVLVVDASGGGDFATMQAAIDAAADGDILLVKPGDYAVSSVFGIFLGDKSLSIVADGSAPSFVFAQLYVTGLGADHTLLLRGLRVRPIIGGAPALRVQDCEGIVYAEDCDLLAVHANEELAFPGAAGVAALDSAAVSLQRCTIEGARGNDRGGFFLPTNGSAAVAVSNSQISICDSQLTGGRGGNGVGGIFDGGSGAPGLVVRGASRVVLSGNTIGGGDGGNPCADPGGCMAGPGVLLEGAGPVLEDLDDAFAGGTGGLLIGGGNQPDGQPLVIDGTGLHVAHSGQAVSAHKVFPLRTGETGTFSVEGPPNALFALFYGFEPGYLPLFHFKGVFQAALPVEGPLILDVLDAQGHYAVDYVAPEIASFGLEGLILVDQLLVDEGADGVVLAGATTHVQVDAGF